MLPLLIHFPPDTTARSSVHCNRYFTSCTNKPHCTKLVFGIADGGTRKWAALSVLLLFAAFLPAAPPLDEYPFSGHLPRPIPLEAWAISKG